ncbi:hypothetical protein TI05_14780 [Achromatium sp. WMS3]|nr:hypothetical protein TI05_14780 [Achromatium sp. WMS3]
MKFEWDTRKEVINIKKHGISFEQASYVFADPFALNRYDDEHSEKEEDRWILLGKSLNEIILVVVHTFKNDENIELVRIISARKATKKEKHAYQQRHPK